MTKKIKVTRAQVQAAQHLVDEAVRQGKTPNKLLQKMAKARSKKSQQTSSTTSGSA